MDDNVTAQAAYEITKLMRAAAQIGRFLADRRRQQLYYQAQRTSQHTRDLRAVLDGERALAAPVYRRALDKRFWETSTPQEAAFVYGVAARFASTDPLADQAARACEQQAQHRWGISLHGQSQDPQKDPVTSADLDQASLQAVAPTLPGEQPQDWDGVLDQAAAQDRRQATTDDHDTQVARRQEKTINHLLTVVEQHPEIAHIHVQALAAGLVIEAADKQGRILPEASQALSQVASQATVPDLLAKQIGGRSWAREAFEVEVSRPLVAAAASPHPGVDIIPAPGPASNNAASASSDQVDVKGARAWFEKNYGSQGLLLTSASEAERDRYAVTLQAALAAEGYDLDDPPRIVDPSSYKFEAEFLSSIGARQELADWLALDPSDIDTHIDPRAHTAFHASWQIVQDGDYPELDNWAWNVGQKAMEAAYGAEELDAGHVRLVGDKPQPGTYLPAMRQAAAAEAAEAGLEVDVYLDHLQPVQRRAVMVGISPSQEDYKKYGPGRARAAQYRVAYAKASAAQRPEWSSRSQAAKEDQGLHAGTVAAAGETADQVVSSGPRWDSQEARDRWAAGLLSKGVDPAAVRAARTGDMSLSRPPKEATAKMPGSTTGRRPPRTQHHGQAQKPRH